MKGTKFFKFQDCVEKTLLYLLLDTRFLQTCGQRTVRYSSDTIYSDIPFIQEYPRSIYGK